MLLLAISVWPPPSTMNCGSSNGYNILHTFALSILLGKGMSMQCFTDIGSCVSHEGLLTDILQISLFKLKQMVVLGSLQPPLVVFRVMNMSSLPSDPTFWILSKMHPKHHKMDLKCTQNTTKAIPTRNDQTHPGSFLHPNYPLIATLIYMQLPSIPHPINTHLLSYHLLTLFRIRFQLILNLIPTSPPTIPQNPK